MRRSNFEHIYAILESLLVKPLRVTNIAQKSRINCKSCYDYLESLIQKEYVIENGGKYSLTQKGRAMTYTIYAVLKQLELIK